MTNHKYHTLSLIIRNLKNKVSIKTIKTFKIISTIILNKIMYKVKIVHRKNLIYKVSHQGVEEVMKYKQLIIKIMKSTS
jgi:hypothetical protein